MMKKTVASLGIAAAASAGALLLTGSPASAQTTTVARTVASGQGYAQQSGHYGDHRGHGRVHHWHHHGDYYGHHHHWYRGYDDTRIEISDTHVSVGD
jgi:Ni/Co efflux regulator RcnB